MNGTLILIIVVAIVALFLTVDLWRSSLTPMSSQILKDQKKKRKNMCKDMHEYINLKVVGHACVKCGFVPKFNLMLSPDNILKQQRLNEKIEEIDKEFDEKVEKYLEKFGLDMKKVKEMTADLEAIQNERGDAHRKAVEEIIKETTNKKRS